MTADRVVVRVASGPEELAAAFEIRRHVFVEEQKIPSHLDADGRDRAATHVLALEGETAVATGRLVATDALHGVLARIAVLPAYRGQGLGRRVVEMLESEARRQGLRRLSLEPHRHLERFYESLGYGTIAGTSVVGEHTLIKMEKHLEPEAAEPPER